MKITLFTLDAHFEDDAPDKSIYSPLHQFCMSTWSIVLDYIKNQGYEAELVVYNNESKEFQYVYKEIISKYQTKNKAHYADIFRMYILSHYPYHIWLDWDVFIRKSFELDLSKPYRLLNWFFVYNADDLETFKIIYNSYKTDLNLQYLGDKETTEYLISKKVLSDNHDKFSHNMLIHCSFLDNSSNLYIVNNNGESSSQVQSHVSDKHNYRFINPLSKHHRGIKGLYNEKSLIKFVLENYRLSEESKEILREALNDN